MSSAFVTPASVAGLVTPAARRAGKPAVCPQTVRHAVTMKKAKRGTNEESNAVDVFGGAAVSQEQLLARALGSDEAVEPTIKKKKKKKGKKGAVLDDDENAVDVFGSTGAAQEDLLADALGSAEPAVVQKGKKKKKGKKGSLVEDGENVVDVLEEDVFSREQLPGNTVGEGSSEELHSKKKKKKSQKVQAPEEGDTVDATTQNGAPSVKHVHVESLVKQNGEVRGSLAADELEQQTTTKEDLPQQDATKGEEEEAAVSEEETDDVEDLSALEGFEPDVEVVDEFESATKEFVQFTSGGRREEKKSKRGERNKSERRLSDAKFSNFGSGGEKYTSVRLEDVTMTFRNSTILSGVTWGVQTGERVGLIGDNGTGKTTQLRIIAGLLQPTSGEVVKSSSRTKASFLRQEFVDELDPTRTLREEFFAAFKEEGELLAAYTKCETDISDSEGNLDNLEALLDQLEELRKKCDEKDAWNLDSRIDKVMPGLGFDEEDNDKLVASFSGGWKVRIGLGKVLLQDPDLLLLDEPSNHLDNESVEWLEAYLQASKLPMVVVSHDREFIDRVCTKIVDIEGGEAFEYAGNYTTFVKLKAEQRKAWESAYERQQKFIKEQENYIKRNRRSPARSSQVKSRQKMLLRMERTGQLVRRPPRQGKPLVFRFPSAPRSGRDCIIVDELTHGYAGRTLFNDTSVTVERGDRIALIGPNGCGKSTLLRLITGREEPQAGTVQCQELTNISLAYYEQNQADALDLDLTVLQTLKDGAPSDMRYEQIRALLGKFLFKGDDVEKKVGALSGGEKARLALAKIMTKPSNVLVFDEPGNHLSISAKEMLEEALQHFDGTLLVVSHDRYLISQVATQILAVEDQQLVLYDGDYKSYMEKNAELRERLQARFIPGVAEIKNAPKVVIEQPAELVEKKQKRKRNFGGSGVNSGKTKEMNAKRWNR